MEDLQPNTYLPLACDALLMVGWLHKDSAYERGAVGEDFFSKLLGLTREPWQPVAAAGSHTCELCQFQSPRFSANVFIPYKKNIYVAPVGVVHYIAAHWYKPPQIFIDAVLECPPMDSMEYKKSLLANGGRSLVQLRA